MPLRPSLPSTKCVTPSSFRQERLKDKKKSVRAQTTLDEREVVVQLAKTQEAGEEDARRGGGLRRGRGVRHVFSLPVPRRLIAEKLCARLERRSDGWWGSAPPASGRRRG